MANNFRGYVNNVDDLIERTPLDLVLGHYGLPLTQAGANEHRMKCVFNAACSDSKYGNLSVKLDAAKRIYCHTCQTKGNLLTLLHGLENHCPPEGGQLRGQEFKATVAKLKEINGVVDSPISKSATPTRTQSDSRNVDSPQRKESEPTRATPISTAAPTDSSSTPSTPESSGTPGASRGSESETSEPQGDSRVPAATEPLKNIPLRRHEKEAARALETLHEELIVDVAQMSPEAAAYVRKRPWMTPELMRKWGCGWIPGNGRSLFRKHYFVYTHRNVRGEVVSYSGRDLTFEKKWDQWIKDGKPEGKKPNKHRYVSGYHRGLELFGAMASRLEEPALRESLDKNGLVIVEGMNDVIRLDELGVCSVGLCSNRATETQTESITKFAKQVATNRVLLFPDGDEEGEAGFKDLLWELNKRECVAGLVSLEDIEAGQPEEIVEWKYDNSRFRSM